jgi:ADP-ribose pyrophosphatase YjhB (NUDIX family)
VTEIRATALALPLDGRRLLVETGTDDVKGERFYRLIGGGIEFGETGEEAIRRELREELDAEVAEVEYLETIENIFVYRGKRGHELCRIYRIRFSDRSLSEREELDRYDRERDVERTLWVEVEDLLLTRLYPHGMAGLLRRVLGS